MFSSWKVPDRVTSSDSRRSMGGVSASDDQFVRGLSQQKGRTPSMLGLARSKTEFPMIHSAYPRPPSQAPSLGGFRGGDSQGGIPHAVFPADPMQAIPEGRISSPRKTRKIRTDELLDPYYQPVHKTAIELLQNGLPSDNYAVKKALELMAQDKHVPLERDIQKWMLSASDQERAVAMEFFQSLAGSKLLNGNSKDSRERVQGVMKMLQKGHQRPSQKAHNAHRSTQQEDAESRELKFIRLLTPNTRANKWMHQTWHHLPNYHDNNPVENRTSMYTQPNKLTPRHFVIRPDLG